MPIVAAPRRRHLVLALVVCVVAALGGFVTTSATAANTAPYRISIDRVSSDVDAPGGVAETAKPRVLVAVDGTIHVDVSFWDSAGDPASFNKDTTLTIATNVGTLSVTTGIALKDSNTARIDTSITSAVNRVVLTVSAGSGNKAPQPGTSYDTSVTPTKDLRFDVLSELTFTSQTKGQAFTGGIGGDDGACGTVSPDFPVCGLVVLPHGANCTGSLCEAPILLSTGACDSTYTNCRNTPTGVGPALVIQTLFDDGNLYSMTDPATLIIKCDKSLCGKGSIQRVPVNFTLGGNSALLKAPGCPAKGTVGTNPNGTDQEACIDWVQSKRDGAGDSWFYVLFPHDIRGSIG